MICVPDEIDPVEGWGWCIHWPCGESENTVLDPTEAMRIHVCPDIGREDESPCPLRLVRPSGAQLPPCSEDAFSDESGRQVEGRRTDSLTAAAIDTKPEGSARFVPETLPSNERKVAP